MARSEAQGKTDPSRIPRGSSLAAHSTNRCPSRRRRAALETQPKSSTAGVRSYSSSSARTIKGMPNQKHAVELLEWELEARGQARYAIGGP
jgi:hypothetical protein